MDNFLKIKQGFKKIFDKTINTLKKFFNKVSKIRPKIDIDKKIGFKEQFCIMLIILFISCILFTFVYFVHSCGISQETNTEISGIESSKQETSKEISNISSDVSENSENQNSENSENSKNQNSENPKNNPKSVLSDNIKYITKDHNEIYNGTLILVNKDFECHHDGENTVQILSNKSNTYVVTDNSVYVNEDIMDIMNSMFDDFYNIYGDTDIMVACAYRSYSLQVQLYNEEINNIGSEGTQWVAPPGFSEHQTGYVFDLNLNLQNGIGGIQYKGEGIYSWINQNCYKYGFILRYLKGKEEITGYEYEPWHFRYVGVEHATYIMNKNITLEEYIDIVHMHTMKNPLEINGDNGEQWLVYYVKASDETTQVPICDNYGYQISGDNYSGFIVTQKIK